MGELIERFPLFPLGVVLLPTKAIPLHIFEERYKLMIGECLDLDREFGILWLSDEQLNEVGCAARITQVLERMEDGRMNILVEGTTPFRLVRRVDDLAYPAGDVELLEDAAADAPDGDAGEAARRLYADLVERVTDERPDTSRLGAYEMAARVEFALEAKQELLELRDEDARLRRLAALFEGALRRLDRAEKVAERARGNGRVQL